MTRTDFFLAFLAVTLVVFSGCSSSQPTRYYVLSPELARGEISSDLQASIGLGPITLPRYLERDDIVTRSGAEIELAGLHRWARTPGRGLRHHPRRGNLLARPFGPSRDLSLVATNDDRPAGDG